MRAKARRRSATEDDHGPAGKTGRVEAEGEVCRIVLGALVLTRLGDHLVALRTAGTRGFIEVCRDHQVAMATGSAPARTVAWVKYFEFKSK